MIRNATPNMTKQRSPKRPDKSGVKKTRPSKNRAPSGASAAKAPPRQGGRSKAQTTPPLPGLWLYGRHAVAAAIKNPDRALRRLLGSETALKWLAEEEAAPPALMRKAEISTNDAIDVILPQGAVHQGLALQVDDLPRARLKDICASPEPAAPVIILDQITDPQNIGAIFRSAAAFGARAIIVQERRTPPLAGALAKAAAGAIEKLPCVNVVNIARAIEALQDLGYHCAGLDVTASQSINTLPPAAPLAIVLGAEGKGLRPLVAKTCDELYAIPLSRTMESLNVSNAAAITLYAAATRTQD